MSDPEANLPAPETPTPGDIEAALSELRARISTPEPAAPPPPDEPRGGAWAGTMALLLGAALLGGLTAGFLPTLLGMAPQGQEDARRRIGDLETRLGQLAAGQSGEAAAQSFADLKARLDGLEVRLRALEAAEAAAPAVDLTPLRQDLSALAERVAALEGRPDAAPQPVAPMEPDTRAELGALRQTVQDLAERTGRLERVAPAGDLIASLDGRLSALEAADPGRASRQAALALIVARLGAAAAEGRPFAAELAALKAASPATDISPFAPYAERGLPTVSALADGLEAIDGAVREGADFDRGGDWFDRTWRGFGRLVTVHEDGLADGMEPEDHLARARYHARRGDLANAHAEMDALSGAARGAAADWLAKAGARLALDKALDAATAKILADLARGAP